MLSCRDHSLAPSADPFGQRDHGMQSALKLHRRLICCCRLITLQINGGSDVQRRKCLESLSERAVGCHPKTQSAVQSPPSRSCHICHIGCLEHCKFALQCLVDLNAHTPTAAAVLYARHAAHSGSCRRWLWPSRAARLWSHASIRVRNPFYRKRCAACMPDPPCFSSQDSDTAAQPELAVEASTRGWHSRAAAASLRSLSDAWRPRCSVCSCH